jgi:hypothetical protein
MCQLLRKLHTTVPSPTFAEMQIEGGGEREELVAQLP